MAFFVESYSSAIKEAAKSKKLHKSIRDSLENNAEAKFLLPIEGTIESFQVFFKALWLS